MAFFISSARWPRTLDITIHDREMSTQRQESKNLKAFDYAAAFVFARLFAEFPEPIDLRGLRMVIEAVMDEEIPREIKDVVGRFLPATVRWLRDEGFIRYESEGAQGTFRKVTLTMRGLTVLGYVPVTLKGSPKEEPLIDKLRTGLKSSAKAAGQEIIKQAIGQSFRLLLMKAGVPSDV